MGIRCFGIAQRGRDVVPDLNLGRSFPWVTDYM